MRMKGRKRACFYAFGEKRETRMQTKDEKEKGISRQERKQEIEKKEIPPQAQLHRLPPHNTHNTTHKTHT